MSTEPEKKIAKGETLPDGKMTPGEGSTFPPSPDSLVFHDVGLLCHVFCDLS
jgi:hypothetical protein